MLVLECERRVCDRWVGEKNACFGRSAVTDDAPAERGRGVVGASVRAEAARLCNLRGGGGFVLGRYDSSIGNRETGSKIVLDLMPEPTGDVRLLSVLLDNPSGMDSGLAREAIIG